MKLTTLILKVISDTDKANDYDQEYWKMTVKKLFSGFQVLKYYNYYIIELIKSLEGASFGFFTKGSSAPAIEKFLKSYFLNNNKTTFKKTPIILVELF